MTEQEKDSNSSLKEFEGVVILVISCSFATIHGAATQLKIASIVFLHFCGKKELCFWVSGQRKFLCLDKPDFYEAEKLSFWAAHHDEKGVLKDVEEWENGSSIFQLSFIGG